MKITVVTAPGEMDEAQIIRSAKSILTRSLGLTSREGVELDVGVRHMDRMAQHPRRFLLVIDGGLANGASDPVE